MSESLGLGLVEAQKLGCKIIASDLPYVKEVVKPSISFDPNNLIDIKEKVKYAIAKSEQIPNSELVLENRLSELIAFIK